MNTKEIEHYRWKVAISVLQNALNGSPKEAAKVAKEYADAFVEAMLLVANTEPPSLKDLCDHVFGSENQAGERECLICGVVE